MQHDQRGTGDKMKEAIAIAVLYGIAIFIFSKKAMEQFRELNAIVVQKLLELGGEEE